MWWAAARNAARVLYRQEEYAEADLVADRDAAALETDDDESALAVASCATVLKLLPDPAIAPDTWTRRSLELRNLASITGTCEECSAGVRNAGVDHREVGHQVMAHMPGCRCSRTRRSTST